MKVEVRIKKWKWKWSWKSKRIKPKKEKVRAKKVKVTLKRWKHKDKKTVNKSKSQGEGVSMSRVWRCQSCNGNCDKGHGRGNAAGRKRGRTGWGFGMGGTLPVLFSKMDFSKLMQKLQISSNSRVKNTFWIFGAALEVWWSTSICIPLAREPGFLPFFKSDFFPTLLFCSSSETGFFLHKNDENSPPTISPCFVPWWVRHRKFLNCFAEKA